MECLISLVVLMGLLIFLQPFLKTVVNIQKHVKKSDYLEVQTGKIQMELEIRACDFIDIKDNRLFYQNNAEGDIIFEQYKEMIRKTSTKKGHQPIMTGVKNVIFEENNGIIQMEVTTLEEETYLYFIFS